MTTEDAQAKDAQAKDAQVAGQSPAPVERASGSAPRGRAGVMWRVAVLAAIVVVVAGAFVTLSQSGALGGRSGSGGVASPTAVASSTATPIAVSSPATTYSADWTQGPDGWALPAGWQIANGQLAADVATDAEVSVPFLVIAPNYSIEIDLQGLRGGAGRGRNHFNLIGRDTTGKGLYYLSIQCNAGTCSGETGLQLDHPATGSGSGVFNDSFYQSDVQTFHLHIAGNEIVRCLTVCDWNGKSAVALSPARLFLVSAHVRVAVTRFVITIP